MSLFEQFITEGNEKANELANDGAMMDGGEMAKMRTSTVQQKREDVHAALQYAASFDCLVEEWQACEELWAKPKKSVHLRMNKLKQRIIARRGVRLRAKTVA